MDNLKLYVVVRNDLSRSQKTVQSIHAATEFVLREKTLWNNGTVVCLKVGDEKELAEIKSSLEAQNLAYRSFYEPDIGNQMTALATVQEPGFELFKSLQLL